MRPEKINNDYVALLLHDFIDIKHPKTKKEIRLYRIISTKTFKIVYTKDDILLDNTTDHEVINIHTIGGYIQSIDNLDPNTENWVANKSKVFDSALITNGTIVKNSCTVYGNTIIDSSRLSDYAKVSDSVKVTNSILTDLIEIKDNAIITNSIMHNASMVFENGKINNTTMQVGSLVRGNAQVNGCYLTDISQIQGDSIVNNCILRNRSVIMDGIHDDHIYDDDANLNIIKHIVE